MSGYDSFVKRKWWYKKAENAHTILFDRVNELDGKLAGRRERNRLNLSRYLNKQFVGMRPGEANIFAEITDNISLNGLHAAISTATSRLCASIPRPYFLTDNGSFEDQEKARNLQKWTQGIISQNDVSTEVDHRVVLDAALFDFGCVKVFASDGKIKIQRVHPDEIIFDPIATQSAPPRELYQVKYYKKEVLAALFPKSSAKIAAAATLLDSGGGGVTDMVRVAEGWHLPSSDTADDGRHIIAIEEEELLVDEWCCDDFPFAFLQWGARPDSYIVGQPLVDILGPIQDELDTIVRRIQESVQLSSLLMVVVDKGSGINKRHLKNIPHIIIEKTGGPAPEFITPQAVHPQIFEWVDRLYGKEFELSGVSQLSSMNVVPERVRGTGTAMRTMLDEQDRRFAQVAAKRERMWCKIAELAINVAHEEAEAGRDIKVNYKDREWIERIDFKNCNLERDKFTIDVYPTNNLPQTPAGKMAMVEQLSTMGAVQDPAMVLELLQLPDVEKHASLETAALRSAHQLCEYMLSKEDNWIPPEEFMDLKLCITVAQKYWVRAHVQKVGEARLENLGRWIKEAMAILRQSQQPTPEQQMQMQQPPAAPPQAMLPPGPEAMPQEAPTDVPIEDPAMLPPTA